MSDSSQIGWVTEQRIILRLVELGYEVVQPVLPGRRYDIGIIVDGCIERIQCKTGRLTNGVIVFNTCSRDKTTQARKYYHGQIDYFGVYCVELDQCFLVPIVDTKTEGRLRVDPPKNNQTHLVCWASAYRL